MSKRIVFTFNDRSYDALEKAKENGNYSSLADTVRSGLSILLALQKQKEQGYGMVKVVNSTTQDERIMVIPDLMD